MELYKSFSYKLKKIVFVVKLVVVRITFRKFLCLFKFFFKTLLLNNHCPAAIIIGLTYECQCKCVHCSVGQYFVSKETELTTNEIKRLIDEIRKLGTPWVVFFGGEPLLREDLIELVSYSSAKGISTSFNTNGLLLTKDKIRELKKAGINNISISIDNPRGEIHDELRGKNNLFDQCISAVRFCVSEKVPCIISTYATKENVNNDDLKKLLSLSRGINVAAVKILFPILSGKWWDNDKALLSEDEEHKVMEMAENKFVYLESPLHSIKRGKKICESVYKKMIYVSPYGDVQPCYAIPITFGNIKDKPLYNIIKDMWESKLFKNMPSGPCVMNNKDFKNKYLWDVGKLPVKAEELSSI